MTIEERLKQFRDEGDTYSQESLAGLMIFMKAGSPQIDDMRITLDPNGHIGASIRVSLNHKLILSFIDKHLLDYVWFLPNFDTRKVYHGEQMSIVDFKHIFNKQIISILNEYHQLLDFKK